MGAGGSRRRPGQPKKTEKMTLGANHPPQKNGYFILSYKGDRVKVVNADKEELKILRAIICRHCEIVKESWDRTMTYCYKLRLSGGRHCLIQLVADTLLSLYQAGWQPLTPLDMGGSEHGHEHEQGIKSAICFQKQEDKEVAGLSAAILGEEDKTCLSLEIFQDTFIGFHNVSHTVLLELVNTIQREWAPGVRGVSMGVASVIRDYTRALPPVLDLQPGLREEKYLQLEAGGEDTTEHLQLTIIASLIREGYRLSMDINMEPSSRVYFFIQEQKKGSVRVPSSAGAGLGDRESLAVYRPLVVRSRKSFLGRYSGGRSLRRKVSLAVRASLRRKAVGRQGAAMGGRQGAAMQYKPRQEGAWWQQDSTENSSTEGEEGS